MTETPAPSRYTKIAGNGEDLSADAPDWVAVRDNATGLIWSRANVGDKRVTQKAAVKACEDLELAGATDWRLPTIRELLTLVDYERFDPAIDTDLFPECQPNWYWTATAAAPSPGDCAWLVGFYDGGADWSYRSYNGFVRAVRASQ